MTCHNCKKEIHLGAKFCSYCGMDIKKSEQEEVKYLYHKLAHKFHPDKTNGNEEMMKKINKAYADGDLETLRTLDQDRSVENIKEPVFENQMTDRTEPVKKSNNNILFAGLIILVLIIISLASSPSSNDPIQEPLATPTKTIPESKPKLSTLLKLPKTSNWNCGDVIAYSGQNYNTVQIGSQCWFKENLNVGVKIAGLFNASKNGIIEKYCYNDSEANCLNGKGFTDGGLYQWDEAMAYSNIEGTRGICPEGWHIPKDSEWYILESTGGFDGVLAGGRLNDGSFGGRGAVTFFWSSTESGAGAWLRGLSSVGFSRNALYKGNGFSVRCLKD